MWPLKRHALVFGGLEPCDPLVAIEIGGLGLGEGALEGGDEVAGALEHRDVAGVLEDLEAAVGEGRLGFAAVLDRDDRVVFAPNDEEWQGFGEVEAVEGGNPLALHVDYRAEGGEEGLAALGIGKGRVAAGDLGEVGVGAQADGAETAADRA